MADTEKITVEIIPDHDEKLGKLKRLMPDELPSISLFDSEKYVIDKFEFKKRFDFTAKAVIFCVIALAFFIASQIFPQLAGFWSPFIWLLGAVGVVMLGMLVPVWKGYGKYEKEFGCRGRVAAKYTEKGKMMIFSTEKHYVTVICGGDEDESYIVDVDCPAGTFNRIKCGSMVLVTCRNTRNLKAWAAE